MTIRCPVCATAIKATEEHVGLKNRCVQCGSKFIIPASPHDEIEVLERGEAPGPQPLKIAPRKTDPPKLTPRMVDPPKTTPLEVAGPSTTPSQAATPKTTPLQVAKPKPGKPVLKTATPKIPGSETPAPVAKGPKALITKSTPLGGGVTTNVPGRFTSRRPLTGRSGRPPIEIPLPGAPAPVAKEPAPTEPLEEVAPVIAEQPAPPTTRNLITPASTPPPTAKLEPAAEPPTASSKASSAHPRESTRVEDNHSEAGSVPRVLKTAAARHAGPATDAPTGSYLDLKVKRTQTNARQVVQAVVVAAVCLIVALVLFLGGGSGREDESGANLAANTSGNSDPDPGGLAPGELLEKPVEPEPEPQPGVQLTQWEGVIHPLIEDHCLKCHDEFNEEGGVELERFTSESMAVLEPELWEKAAKLVRMGDMPPRDEHKQPTDEDRAQFVAWVESVGERWDTGEFGVNPGRTTIRRLTKNEYNYTLRDLFGLKLRPADGFPEDGGGEDGFDNNADALFLPPLLMENYVEAAGLIVNAVYQDQETYNRYLFAFPHSEGSVDDAVRKVVAQWAPRLYRRPVEKREIDNFVSLVRFQMDKKKKDYRTAMKMPLLAMLISPHFLYRAEKIQPGGKAYPVEDVDLASRLSYFLWTSTPDPELLKAAFEGKLSKPDVFESQVRRMLMDDKAKSLGMHFAGQWLKWENLRSGITPDKRRFPKFDFELRVQMYRESSLFFDHLIRNNRPLLDLIDSDYSILTPRLAIHYDIPGVRKPGFQKVMLDDPNRGGVIGMASVLTATSLPLRSSPAIRGNYILTELLGTPPPAPPMNVPQLPEDDEAIEFTSFRDALIKHREDPNCKACHEAIDPLGFGLENYDAIGRWRGYQNDQLVDASGVLPDGSTFANPVELKQILMKKKDLFTRNMVRKALSFALGRELTPYDRHTVRTITGRVIADDYKIQTLFLEVARSYPFLNCRGDDYTQNSSAPKSNNQPR